MQDLVIECTSKKSKEGKDRKSSTQLLQILWKVYVRQNDIVECRQSCCKCGSIIGFVETVLLVKIIL